MADVRMPDGTVIRNVPDGTTKAELMARVAKMRGEPTPPRGIKQTFAGPPGPTFTDELSARLSLPGDRGHSVDLDRKMFREVAQEAEAIQNETPFLERMNARFQPGQLAPLLGLGAGAMVPGAGWGSLLLGSALSGGVTALGDMARQNVRGDVDVAQSLKTGATEGAANLAGGAVLKGLGATARALFHSELDDAAKAGVKFAREQGAPFPLSSAAPASRAGRIQQGSRSLLPGDIRTQVDANKVTTFLNNQVAKITDNASPLDEAATKGQQFLRQVFEPGETIYTQTFKNLRNTVGDETPIPITKARQVMEGAADALKKRGEMKSVYNRLQNVLKGKATELTAAQVDELYSGLLKDAARNANARREVNAVLSAVAEDADVVGKNFGINFGDDLAKAKAVRDQYRELRNIPGLERLGKDFGEKGGTLGTRQWMSELFANPNGKALAELRARNPQLYHELADSWVANNLNRFSRPVKDGFGRALDGNAFRAWYEQNAPALKVVLGGKQAQALDNFSLYAKHMTGAVERSVQGSRGMDPMAMLARGGAEGAAVVKQPWLMIPGEAASYVLAKGLSDPSSMLFKAFTEGFSPATRSFVIKSGQLGAQAGSKKANGEDSR